MATTVNCDVCDEEMNAFQASFTVPAVVKRNGETIPINVKLSVEEPHKPYVDICKRCIVAAILCIPRRVNVTAAGS